MCASDPSLACSQPPFLPPPPPLFPWVVLPCTVRSGRTRRRTREDARRRKRIFYEKVAKGNGMSRAYFFAFAGAAEGNSIKHPISSLYVVYVHIFGGGGEGGSEGGIYCCSCSKVFISRRRGKKSAILVFTGEETLERD